MRYFLVLVALMNLAVVPVKAQTNAFDGLTVIGNKTGTSQLTKANANDVFRGRSAVWANGNSVVLVLPSQRNDNSALVARLIYQTTVKGMQKYWLSLVFQGRGNPPVFLDTDKEIVEYVLRTPGAIGIVNQGYPTDKKSEILIK